MDGKVVVVVQDEDTGGNVEKGVPENKAVMAALELEETGVTTEELQPKFVAVEMAANVISRE